MKNPYLEHCRMSKYIISDYSILIEILLFDGKVSIMCCCKYVPQSQSSKTTNSCHKIKILSVSQQTTPMWASPPFAHLHTWQTHIVTQQDQSQQSHTAQRSCSVFVGVSDVSESVRQQRGARASCAVPGTVSKGVLDLELIFFLKLF